MYKRQSNDCPIERWPDDPTWTSVVRPDAAGRDVDLARTAGPAEPIVGESKQVWITAESLAPDDPALAARPDLPAIFVFDRPLLERLRLSAKRLVFLVETLAEIAEHRPLELVLGEPATVLAGRRVAVTFAPVPGFRRIAHVIEPTEVHPARWLARPHAGSISSFSAWRKRIGPLPG